MRLSALFLRIGVFVLAAIFAVLAARTTVAVVEDTSAVSVRETLIDRGYDWTSVLADGLQVILEGEAPTEAVRFRAISAAGSMVDASRVIDNMKVAESGHVLAPDFAIEILRNDSGVSLIGLIPADTDREELATRITKIADGGISDASVPPAATTPAASFLSYPCLSISGIATRENTAAVAVDAPDTAANPAVANTVATARPPGTQPTHLRAASKSCCVMPA